MLLGLVYEVGSMGILAGEDSKLVVMHRSMPIRAKASKKGPKNKKFSPTKK